MPLSKAQLVAAVLGGARFNGHPYSDYLLLDTFSAPLAAGAVNGTLPVVGGARTVTDTNSKLSIAGGVASFATGGAGVGDPGLWEAGISRAFGKTVLLELNTSIAANTVYGGWDSNQAGIPSDAFQFESTLRLRANSTEIVVGAFSISTQYSVAIVLRSSGCYYFIKGGAFTNWTLVYASATGNSATMYPVAAAGATTSVFTADNLRVPAALYSVPVLAYDTFTRANGALGSTETAGADAQAVTARAWADSVGTWGISTNKAVASALSGGVAIATVDTGVADVVVDIAATRAAGSAGCVLRYADANNYLRATTEGTNCLIEQVVAGTPTTLRTGAVTYGAGNVIRVIVSGTTGWLFYNGAAVGASFTVPSSSATAHGLYTSNTGNSLDVLQVMSRGVDNAYGWLDSY